MTEPTIPTALLKLTLAELDSVISCMEHAMQAEYVIDGMSERYHRWYAITYKIQDARRKAAQTTSEEA